MSRRVVVAVAVVLVLICGRLLVSRGIHPVAAAHYSAAALAVPAPEVKPRSSGGRGKCYAAASRTRISTTV